MGLKITHPGHLVGLLDREVHLEIQVKGDLLAQSHVGDDWPEAVSRSGAGTGFINKLAQSTCLL